MNNAATIKDLIKNINRCLKNTRKNIREALFKIEELGGYVALGYESVIDFYDREFEHNASYLSRQSTTKDIELLLGLPIGTGR